ncbi:unnamed protein product [Durusdinium trenchii]|uniref:Uncharacterized protein n=1 Tax=Durusdinium trenchii TaxID=1381693 RepID=A0ABP0HN28_9DINO
MGSGGSTQFYQLTPAEEQDFAALSQEEQQKISTALSRLEEDRAQASGWDNIINAAGAGLVQTVRRFLQEDPAAVQSTDENGRTALQLAALNRHAQVVKELLAARAAVQAADHDGDTSLHHAAFGSSAEVVQDLLAARADVDAKNNNGRTALDFAQMKGCQDVVALLSFATWQRFHT